MSRIIKNNIQNNTLQTFCHCIFSKKENTGNSRWQKINRARGFSLIEMMVAVSIFAIVVMISMTSILSVVDSNKKAQSLKSVMNNLNFALDTMTRSIKTGEGLSVSSDGKSVFVTEDKILGESVEYELGTFKEGGPDYSHTLMRNNEPITAPEVVINNLKFIDGMLFNGGVQPSVIMIIQGSVKINERVSSDFNIQTTVTVRDLTPE